MKKLFEKWYVSMFLIPIILTYLTSFIQLPDIFSNWEYSIIISLIILVFILILELNNLNKRFLKLSAKPDKRDKQIIRDLLSTLDLNEFHEHIVKQDAWNGYRKEAIYKTLEFTEKVSLIKNKTSDAQLNSLLLDFTDELERFHEFSSLSLFGADNFFLPDKHTEIAIQKSRSQSETMNRMTSDCFDKLELLMEFLRTRKYL